MVEWRKSISLDEIIFAERSKSGIYRLNYRNIGFDFDSETRKIINGDGVVLLTEDRSELLSRLLDGDGCVWRDELCGEFWGGVDLAVARPRLSNLIHLTKKDLMCLRNELGYSLGYVEGYKKVRWNVGYLKNWVVSG